MQNKRVGPLALVLIAMAGAALLSQAGCSQKDADTPPVTNTTPPAAPASTATPPSPEAAPAPAPAASPEGAGQESAGEDAPSDADRANALLAQAMTPPQTFSEARWKQGTHYAQIKPAQPTAAGPGKIEVLEMFWYGCPHCYGLEPYLQVWEPKKAAYIQFTRVPATWGIGHQLHARLYYTLMALNRADLHMKAFSEIQKDPRMMLGEDEAQTERIQAEFAKRNGIDPALFRTTYRSPQVTKNIEHADMLLRRYRVDTVPHIVINGKYFSDVSAAGGPDQLMALINDLAAREHSAKP